MTNKVSGEKRADIFGDNEVRAFTSEEEEQKRFIYEKMSTRNRKFVDRIGYDKWDPFQLPKEPMDIRMDVTKRTTQELVRDFMQTIPKENVGNDYSRGVLESALGIVTKDEKFRGIFEFCLWYSTQLEKD